ncbi:50S ribosomal protein L29 [Candidatus Berkelbacteria bacterium]|nr:50S ribosomal protein L29 [Candidatus Berkelbacteria bacterium]
MSQSNKFLTSIRKYDPKKLTEEIGKRNEAIRTLRFDLGFGTVSSLKDLRVARRELAQLKTVLKEKSLAETK